MMAYSPGVDELQMKAMGDSYMDSHVYWIGVAVLVGVGLIVPIQAKEGSLDVATRTTTDASPVLRHGPRRAARRSP